MYQYQVSFGDAIKRAFSNYCDFNGRASRSEYWWWTLFCFIVSVAINIIFIKAHTAESVVSSLWGLATLLPSLGLLFRRLHDTGRSGWNVLWALLPLVGAIILIVYCCQPSQPEENPYGPVPNTTEA